MLLLSWFVDIQLYVYIVTCILYHLSCYIIQASAEDEEQLSNSLRHKSDAQQLVLDEEEQPEDKITDIKTLVTTIEEDNKYENDNVDLFIDIEDELSLINRRLQTDNSTAPSTQPTSAPSKSPSTAPSMSPTKGPTKPADTVSDEMFLYC